MKRDPSTITRLLREVREDDVDASRSLLPLVYDELHGLASALFQSERSGHTLQPTALIHEAWLKLAGPLADRDHLLTDRRHFFALAARVMRQVLTDHARRCRSQKRGDGRHRVTFDDGVVAPGTNGFDLIEFDELLTRLASKHARHARVVELRILGGLTIAETAETLGVAHSTVEGDWFMARAWLRGELGQAQ